MDLRLVDGDLSITNDLEIVSGIPSIVQHLSIRLKLFRGELVFATNLGVQFYEYILVKRPTLELAEFAFREVILGTPGILSLDGFDLTFDTSQRSLSLDFDATSNDGTDINYTDTLEI